MTGKMEAGELAWSGASGLAEAEETLRARFRELMSPAQDRVSRKNRPLVLLSYAQSIDGSLTARRGRSLPLSGSASLRFTHHLRASHDAILVGIGTVLADDPRLTVRHAEGSDPRPIVIDSALRCPPSARLLQHAPSAWVFTTARAPADRWQALESAGARIWKVPAVESGRIDLLALLEILSELGIGSLMVEGGAGVITSFFAQQLAQVVALTIAPAFVGGLHAVERPLASVPEPRGIDDFPRLSDPTYHLLPPDLILLARCQYP